jgi:hypothetical protein
VSNSKYTFDSRELRLSPAKRTVRTGRLVYTYGWKPQQLQSSAIQFLLFNCSTGGFVRCTIPSPHNTTREFDKCCSSSTLFLLIGAGKVVESVSLTAI